MSKKKKATSSWSQIYIEVSDLGEGGNANVKKVKDSHGHEFALKELSSGKRSDNKKKRFQDEIKIMTDLKGTKGVLPVYDSNDAEFWYVMPIAEPILNHIKTTGVAIQELKVAILQLTEALTELHHKEVCHRDIKPTNLYFFDGSYCFGDFGLADFPDHVDNLTIGENQLGAKFTMAPEMRRNPDESDGYKADVYSLAKTIWMLLSDEDMGFDGVYDYHNENISLRFRDKLRGIHLAELEVLLNQATQNSPEARPSMDDFLKAIINWIEVSEDIIKAQESDWDFLSTLLFGSIVPRSVMWVKTDDIIDVLNTVASIPAYNHVLFSDHGGLDLYRVEKADETGWIDLILNKSDIHRILPKALCFESFEDDVQWNYFRLELRNASSILEDSIGQHEILVEDTPSHYVSSLDSCYGVYDYDTGKKLPEGWRLLSRYTGGTCLIVMKMGYYNHIHFTYDGRHGDCNNEAFRCYIEKMQAITQKARASGRAVEQVLNDIKFSKNPFIKEDDIEDVTSDTYERVIQYLSENVSNWNFPIKCEREYKQLIESNQLLYYFEYTVSEDSYFDLFDEPEQKRYLGREGRILFGKKEDLLDKILFCASMDEAIKILSELMEFVKKELFSKNYELPIEKQIFTIGFQKGEIPPTHLFTKDEICDEMRRADDRTGNYLVVDCDGYAHVEHEIKKQNLFPVRCEYWSARTNYVGKYSDLSALDDTYLLALDGWLMYLKTGEQQYADYTEITVDTKILEKIKSTISDKTGQ